ncbi:unnamed protein product, partial [Nesidiocoris tenuis]
MDHTNADLDPLTFSDRIAQTVCLNLEQTTTFNISFVKIGSVGLSQIVKNVKKEKSHREIRANPIEEQNFRKTPIL